MAWFRVDDGFHSSRKLHNIPKRQRFAAAGLWAIAGSWAMDEMTDGHIPDSMIAMWGPPPSAAQALVNAGLWDRTRDGFDFRNWDEYQASREDLEGEKEANRLRKRASRNRLKQQKLRDHAENEEASHVTGHDVTDPSHGGVTAPIPFHTIPLKELSDEPDEFDRWYAMYPRKEAKAAARKAFAKARKSADMDTLVQSLERYVESMKGKDRQYIALPASWLNAGRWEDEYGNSPALFPATEGIDVDAVLGRDVWSPPTAPPELWEDPDKEREWMQQRRAEHRAERLEEAKQVLARRRGVRA